ncbi:MAG: hypothetical protein QW650_01040 [Thermofilum sp.]
MKADLRKLVRAIGISAKRIVAENGLRWIPPGRFAVAVRAVFEPARPGTAVGLYRAPNAAESVEVK